MNDYSTLSLQSLKKVAKHKAKTDNIALSKALDAIAKQLGYTHWALLAKHFNSIELNSAQALWTHCRPGVMVLLSANANAGKLSLAMQFALYATNQGQAVTVISETDTTTIQARLNSIAAALGFSVSRCLDCIHIDSNRHSLAAITEQVNHCPNNRVFIVDYLQALSDHDDAERLLPTLKQAVHNKRSQLIMLTQPPRQGDDDILQHFNHAIVLENTNIESGGERSLHLVKSTHYRLQQNLLAFESETFCFQ